MRISDWSSDVCSSDLQLATRLDRLILLIVLHFGDRGGIAQRIEQAFQLARNLALLGDSNSLRLILEFVFPFVETEEGIAGLAGPTILHDRKIGRAHVCTPVTNAQLVCRLLLAQKKTK